MIATTALWMEIRLIGFVVFLVLEIAGAITPKRRQPILGIREHGNP